MGGVRLMLAHPELPSCEDCQRYVHDPQNGWQRAEKPRGSPTKRQGGIPTPCHACPKIPTGARPHPANAIELTDDNYRVYLHYQRCKAVGRFPEDPIVEHNAGLIRTVEDCVARDEQTKLVNGIWAAAMAAAVTRRK